MHLYYIISYMLLCFSKVCNIVSRQGGSCSTIVLFHLSAQGYSDLFQWKPNISTISFLSFVLFLPFEGQTLPDKVGIWQMNGCGSLGTHRIPRQDKQTAPGVEYCSHIFPTLPAFRAGSHITFGQILQARCCCSHNFVHEDNATCGLGVCGFRL